MPRYRINAGGYSPWKSRCQNKVEKDGKKDICRGPNDPITGKCNSCGMQNSRKMTYHAGKNDIIETEANLLQFNKPGALPKFTRLDVPGNDPFVRQRGETAAEYKERLAKEMQRLSDLSDNANDSEEQPVVLDEQELQRLSIRELGDLAKQRGVNLTGVTRKNDMIRAIMAVAASEAA